jgi:hypothetical protein
MRIRHREPEVSAYQSIPALIGGYACRPKAFAVHCLFFISVMPVINLGVSHLLQSSAA